MIIHNTSSSGSEEVEEVSEFIVSVDNRTL